PFLIRRFELSFGCGSSSHLKMRLDRNKLCRTPNAAASAPRSTYRFHMAYTRVDNEYEAANLRGGQFVPRPSPERFQSETGLAAAFLLQTQLTPMTSQRFACLHTRPKGWSRS